MDIVRPDLIGINNRDLRTFTTRLEHTLDLMPRIPDNVSVVSESGVKKEPTWIGSHWRECGRCWWENR